MLIPITGLPRLRILLEPIRNVPSPPVVTTMSAQLSFKLGGEISTNTRQTEKIYVPIL